MTDDTLVATPSQTVGPFFHGGLPAAPNGSIADRLPEGERIRLLIRVTDGEAQPVTDALVELWQAGVFSRKPTGDDGACEFEAVYPAAAATGADGVGATRIDVCLFARGLLRQLHTRIYFTNDPALEGDAVLSRVPDDRRVTLLACQDAARPDTWRFDIRLRGARETVFFDL